MEIDAALNAKQELHSNVEDWNKLYEGVRPAKSSPWTNCSNLHLPLTSAHVDSLKAQICQTVFGTTPYWRIEGRESSDEAEGRAQNWETWLQFCADARLGLRGKGGELIHGALKHGTAVGKLTWERSERRIREMVPVGRAKKTLSTILGYFTGKDARSYEIRERTYQRGRPVLSYVPLRDFVMIPAEATTIESALAVGDRKRVRLAEVREKERLGVFEEGTAEELKGRAGTQQQQPTETQEAQGITPQQEADALALRSWDQWELIYRLPLSRRGDRYTLDEENGEEQDCLLTLIADGSGSGLIARCIIYPWFHGRRHYIPFRALPRDGDFLGRSVCEVLRDINDALDSTQNQDTDYFTLLVNRPIIGRKGAQATDRRGNSVIEFAPGGVIWVTDPKDLEFMPMPASPPDTLSRLDFLISFAERVDAVTESKMGRRERGSTTLGAIEIAESQGNVRLEDMIASIQGVTDYDEGSGLKELAYQLIGLTIQYEDPEQTIRVLGEEGPIVETVQLPQDLEEALGMYDYVPQGNTYTSNQGQQRAQSVMLHDRLMQNPLVTSDPKRMHAVTKQLLVAHGEKNWKAYIGTEEEAEQMGQQQAEAAQQQAAMEQGGPAQGPEGLIAAEPPGSEEESVPAEWIPAASPEEAAAMGGEYGGEFLGGGG